MEDGAPPSAARSMQMLDIIMLALGLAFFALSVGYTIACDRL
jgi:SNF family Na+-dependent transporter